jgi:hypothetical protein
MYFHGLLQGQLCFFTFMKQATTDGGTKAFYLKNGIMLGIICAGHVLI